MFNPEDSEIASLEFLAPYNVYLRESMIYRESQLRKTFPLDGKYVFPKNCMLHLMTNISSNKQQDGIDLDGLPFLHNKSVIRYVKHIVDFDILGRDYRKKFASRIFRANLRSNLTQWNKANREIMVPVRQFGKLVDNQAVMLIANYNPLSRVSLTGSNKLQEWYRFETLMVGMLSQIHRYNRNQFLIFEVPDNVTYDYQQLSAINHDGKLSISRIKSTDMFGFVLLSLGLLLEDPVSTVSPFKAIHNNNLRYVNLMFVRGDKTITVNIATLLELCTDRNKTKRFLDSICDLSKVTKLSISAAANHKASATNISTISSSVGTTTNTPSKDVKQDKDKPIVVSKMEESPFESDTAIEDTEGTYVPKDKGTPEERELLDIIEDDTKEFIDTQDITPKQKERADKVLSKKYENIKLNDGRTLKQVLDEPVDTNITAANYSELKGKVPNDDMLKATTEVFDSQYLEKQFRKDIVASIVAFQTNGLFVSNFVEEDEVNEFTRVRHTKVSFEDINGKKHTINFKYPLPDDDGYLLINGVKLSMTKQMVNVPICKVSATRVSLISNYNKTLVEKVTSAAYTLPSVLAKNADKLGLTLTSIQQSFLNVDAPYEYKSIGIHYGEITTKDYHLVFDYTNRFDLLKVDKKDLQPSKTATRFTFPRDEAPKILKALEQGKPATSLRAMKGIGKYKPGNTYSTKYGFSIVIEHVKQLDNFKAYANAKSLTDRYIKRLTRSSSFEEVKFHKVDATIIGRLEAKHGVLLGTVPRKKQYLFMDNNNRITVVDKASKEIVEYPIRLVDLFGDSFNIPFEWCNLKILDKNLPIIFVLAYRFGLSHILAYLKMSYQFIPKGTLAKASQNQVKIKFSDGTLLINRYPLVSSFILSGLKHFGSLRNYSFDSMDDKDIYYQLLMDKGMSINYLKGIDNHFTFFIDPITRDVLAEMNEPTNTKDLLIRAVEMLVYESDKPPASMTNFRVRSFEKIPATIYNEISRQYANYINSDYKDSSFSINTEAIHQRIIQDQTVALKEEINPVHAIKEKTKVTYTGFGGRTQVSFVERDRQYPVDGKGILSESTVDSGSVSLNAFLTPNAAINNTRGTFTVGKDLNSTNTLSTVSQLLPFATSDD